MKRLKVLLSIVLTLVVAFSLFACSTTALWQRQGNDTQKIDVDSEKVNGSEKYIVYAALDESGDLIASGAETTAAAYAVVGYTGLVAELVIPSTYRDATINDLALPVTHVLVVAPYADYQCSRNGAAYTGDDARLANQTVVTSIVFGANVIFVGAGVCAGMTNLTTVHFEHVQAGVTATNAFLGCSPTITYRAS